MKTVVIVFLLLKQYALYPFVCPTSAPSYHQFKNYWEGLDFVCLFSGQGIATLFVLNQIKFADKLKGNQPFGEFNLVILCEDSSSF